MEEGILSTAGEVVEVLPTPLFGDVLIANPMSKELAAKIDEEAKVLPDKEKEEYFASRIQELWKEVEILAVGDDCRTLQIGDKAIGGANIIQQSLPTPDGKYLLVAERSFRAKW